MSRSSKRPAQSNLDDEDGDDASQDLAAPDEDHSSSPPTTGGRKRRRISDDTERDEDDGSDPDTPLSDYGAEDEQELELAATQAIRQKRARQQGNNKPAGSGILLNVECINFMCHEHMVFELGPLINFICGKNGSGKSAILTAIVLCLGGKASTTNRGQSLKSFVQEGKDYARIICRIKNEGPDAFQPEEYGDVIELERHFSRHGGSGFKIKNERGRVISTRKADLESISDHFCLQIDNPLNVLSQDMARQFIASSNAAEKYKHFLKGVQLEQLDQDYRLIEEQITNIEDSLERKRPDIEILERKRDQAKARQEAMQKKDKLRSRLQDLRRQIAWVQVQEVEKFRDDLIDDLAQADAKIEEEEQRVTELDEIYQASDAANVSAKEQFAAASAAQEATAGEKNERTAKRDECKTEVLAATTEQRKIRGGLTNSDARIAKNIKDIETEERRIAEIQGGGAAERLRELTEARTRFDEAQSTESYHRSQIGGLDNAAREANDILKNRKATREVAQVELDSQKENLAAFERNRDDLDKAFNPNMSRLMNAIQQNASQFRTRPVGPVGRHIRLLRPEWSSILERSLGTNLSGFIVTSKHDNDLLSGLMKRTNCHVPTQIVNTIPLSNIADHEPDQRFVTVLRVLEIDNELVRKQLILQNGIEQTILISDLKEASSTMYDGGQRLRNVKRCFCLDPHNRRAGFVLSYTRSGHASQDPVAEYAGSSRMRTDSEAQLRMRQEAVRESEEKHRAAETDFYTARDDLQKATQKVVKAKKQAEALQLATQRCDDDVNRLKDATEADTMDHGALNALQDALKAAREEKAVNEELYKDSVINLDEKKARLNAAQADLNAWDAEIEKCEQAWNHASNTAAKADRTRTFNLQEKNNAVARVEDAKKSRESIDAMRLKQEQTVEDYIAQARTFSERVNVPEGMTKDKLKEMYESLKKDLDRFQRQMGGSADEIAKVFEMAQQAFKKGKRDLDGLESMQSKMVSSLQRRKDRWLLFRSHITVRAKVGFTVLLSERSFRGELITDHKQKLMELRVEPDITKRNGQGRNTRTLSGGEKSFSQICLLLSIWEAMGSPIRCLDEFDVFMDAVNRNLSVNLLVDAARSSVGRQFILISPGTKNDIQEAPDIRAQEIAAPERGQTRLNFARA